MYLVCVLQSLKVFGMDEDACGRSSDRRADSGKPALLSQR